VRRARSFYNTRHSVAIELWLLVDVAWSADPQDAQAQRLTKSFGSLVDLVPLWQRPLRELLLARGGATIQPTEEECLVNPKSLHG